MEKSEWYRVARFGKIWFLFFWTLRSLNLCGGVVRICFGSAKVFSSPKKYNKKDFILVHLHVHCTFLFCTFKKMPKKTWQPSTLWGTLPETNIFAPENGWLEYNRFLLRWPIFRCELLMVQKSQTTTWDVKNPVNNGRPQLPTSGFLVGFLNHQQYPLPSRDDCTYVYLPKQTLTMQLILPLKGSLVPMPKWAPRRIARIKSNQRVIHGGRVFPKIVVVPQNGWVKIIEKNPINPWMIFWGKTPIIFQKHPYESFIESIK